MAAKAPAGRSTTGSNSTAEESVAGSARSVQESNHEQATAQKTELAQSVSQEREQEQTQELGNTPSPVTNENLPTSAEEIATEEAERSRNDYLRASVSEFLEKNRFIEKIPDAKQEVTVVLVLPTNVEFRLAENHQVTPSVKITGSGGIITLQGSAIAVRNALVESLLIVPEKPVRPLEIGAKILKDGAEYRASNSVFSIEPASQKILLINENKTSGTAITDSVHDANRSLDALFFLKNLDAGKALDKAPVILQAAERPLLGIAEETTAVNRAVTLSMTATGSNGSVSSPAVTTPAATATPATPSVTSPTIITPGVTPPAPPPTDSGSGTKGGGGGGGGGGPPPNNAPTDITLSTSSIAENSANGTVIGNLLTKDPDTGDSFTYTLLDNAGGRFSVNGAGQIIVANSGLLDFETTTSHAIKVESKDSGGLTVIKDFTVTVTNVNEAPSTITDTNAASNSVAENAANGTVVGITAKATDPEGTAIVYSLTDNAGGRFAIHASTGVITVADGTKLNFEAATSHTLTVQASDGVNNTTQNFTVNITNVNEGPAGIAFTTNGTLTTSYLSDIKATSSSNVFGGLQYDKVYWQGLSLNGEVYVKGLGVHAPNGGGARNTVDFNIGGATTFKAILGLNDDGGDQNLANGDVIYYVYVDGVLKYTSPTIVGTTPLLEVAVDVTGGTTLRLEVGNADGNHYNDNANWTDARFETNTASNLTATLSENVVNGATVGTVAATDPEGQTITYSLTNNAGGRFAINATTGVITVADESKLDYGNFTTHTVRVRATDASSAFTEQALAINLAPSLLTGGNDNLSGTGANDVFRGQGSHLGAADTVAGGAGTDRLVLSGDAVTFNNTTHTNVTGIETFELLADAAHNLTFTDAYAATAGFSGTLTVSTQATIQGVTYNSSAYSGTVSFSGGGGNDSITTGTGAATINGGGGNDTITVGWGGSPKTLNGGDGNDTLNGGATADVLNGGNGDDDLIGNTGGDTYTGGAGADRFIFTDSFLSGTTGTITDFVQGTDSIWLRLGYESIGTAGSATERGQLEYKFVGGNTEIYDPYTTFKILLNGNITLTASDFTFANVRGTAAGESLTGDRVAGYAGNDTITANGAYNQLNGGAGDDVLNGNNHFDLLFGGAGNDTLYTGLQADTLAGGSGSDVIIYTTLTDLHNDVMLDFVSGTDKLDFTGTNLFWRDTSAFSGTKAEIRWAASGGNTIVYVDSDGNGTSDYQMTLQGITSVVSGDFIGLSLPLAASNTTNTQVYTEDTAYNFTDIVITGGQANVTATLTLSNAALGSLSTGTSGAVTSTYNAGTGVWQASGARADVNALLAGLTFAPVANGNGNGSISVNITDGVNTPVNGTITLNGTAVNDAPVLSSALVEQLTSVALGINYTFAAGSFTDVDGDSLTYTATLHDGSALPAWLSFNGGSRTFSAAGGAATAGSYNIRVTATDPSLATTTGNYMLFVAANGMYGTAGTDILTGGASAEVGIGLASNDFIYSNGGADSFFGGDGNDMLVGADGSAMLFYGGNGNDTLQGFNGADSLFGDANDDLLMGAGGNDSLNGGDGIDRLVGGNGADTLEGGNGADVYMFADNGESTTATPDIIIGFQQGATQDLIATPSGYTGIASGAASGATLGYTFNGTHTIITGASGTFEVRLLGNYTLTAADFLFATGTSTSGNDTINGTTGNEYITGQAGNDSLVGNSGLDTLYGGAGNDFIRGDSNSWSASGVSEDFIDGGDGDDTIWGDHYSDTIYGGAGNDVFVYNFLHSSTFGNEDIIEDFVKGEDRIQLSALGILGVVAGTPDPLNALIGYVYNAAFNRTELTYNFGGGNDFRLYVRGNITFDATDFIFSNNVVGTAAGESLTTTAANTGIVGFAGNDTISIAHKSAFDDMYLNSGDGDDTVNVTISVTVRGRLGEGNDTYTGNSSQDRISGDGGDDTINLGSAGGGTNDYANGGDGNDSITQGNGASDIYGGNGNDTVSAGAGNDTIAGEDGNDSLDGGDNNDSILGGNGDDTIFGNLGNDILFGNDGNDYIEGNDGNDTIGINLMNDTVWGNAGSDQFRYGESQGYSGAYGTLSVISDFVSGTDNLRLYGLGFDSIIAGAGNDEALGYSYDIGTNRTIFSDEYGDFVFHMVGNISIVSTDYSFTNQTLGSGAAESLAGSNSASGALLGYGGNDTLTAGSGTSNRFVIKGGSGDDVISTLGARIYAYGGTGNDTITAASGGGLIRGEEGNDSLIGNSGRDTIFGGDNNDIINANADNDVLHGENGNDTIDGGSGNDTITGGSGVDSITGGVGTDRFVYTAATDSGMGAGNRDIITDFKESGQPERIDFSAFTGTFTFSGTAAYDANPATIEVRYVTTASDTIVQVDSDGDGNTNFEIQLTGIFVLASSDFVL